jgi:hypothetical protein
VLLPWGVFSSLSGKQTGLPLGALFVATPMPRQAAVYPCAFCAFGAGTQDEGGSHGASFFALASISESQRNYSGQLKS